MGVMDAIRASKQSGDRPQTEAVRSAACLNCGTPLSGPFCAACGQRDIPPYPSVRELAIDAFWELSGWDGRFASSVRALVRRPGMLTREFLEGRRARYVSPLRLYLMASLLYFLIAAAAPEVRTQSGKTLFLGLRVGSTVGSTATGSASGRAADTPAGAQQAPGSLSAEKAAVLEEIKQAPAVIQPFLRRAIENPTAFKRAILEAMPRMLFALLPVFAAIVALFYRGRKYPEHLYFAIHLHAFIFLALAVMELLRFTRSPGVAVVAGLTALVWIPIYATLSFRRVYGGSLVRTLMKEAGIAAIYGLTSFAAFIVVVYWVSIAT